MTPVTGESGQGEEVPPRLHLQCARSFVRPLTALTTMSSAQCIPNPDVVHMVIDSQ